jgi:hypothetical protein
MWYKLLMIVLMLLTRPVGMKAQTDFPKDYFRAPVDFRMLLSGTFGELRSNHFHSGIDIKTGGVTGKPLLAVADGYVSRISVSSGGFGKAIYINHPNGYTSVYGHCDYFADSLAQWVRAKQYQEESFAVNLFPEPGQFAVKKGEVIAFSGNSGSSGGPHLHFELRTTTDEIPMNPLLFGFDIRDFTRPTMQRMKIYPVGNNSFVKGRNKITEFALAGWGPDYRLQDGDTISLAGTFYFGIDTYDRLNDSDNKNGVFAVRLVVDSTEQYSHRMQQFSFDESRYINAMIDYEDFSKRKVRYQKTYIAPGNKLSVYETITNKGLMNFNDGLLHRVQYVVEDAYGNTSVITFYVQAAGPYFRSAMQSTVNPKTGKVFDWDTDNEFLSDDFRLELPRGTLYDTLSFSFSQLPGDKSFYTPIFKVHHSGVPIHDYGKIFLKPQRLPSGSESKALVVQVPPKGDLIPVGGKWEEDWLVASIRSFGSYSVVIDSVAPTIAAINIANGKNVSDQKNITFRIDDALSGIAGYRGTINDKWILMDYDAKNKLLVYTIDERMPKGSSLLKLEVTDERGNKKTYQAKLVR